MARLQEGGFSYAKILFLYLTPKNIVDVRDRFSFGERENPFFSCEKKGFSQK